MQCKTVVLWWLVNDKEHPDLKVGDRRIEALMPLVAALFPGINYYSVTGFTQVMRGCVIPVLKKRFPALLATTAEEVASEATTEIVEALPSMGYQWQDDPAWKAKFENLLAAA